MTISPLTAANAYQNQMKVASGAADGTDTEESGGATGGGQSFMDMVGSALKSAADTQYKSEATHMKSLTDGKVEISDMVTAVSNAELSLNTVVAIRDRVINAYNDIIKMSI